MSVFITKSPDQKKKKKECSKVTKMGKESDLQFLMRLVF